MRFLVLIIVILLLAYALWPEQPVPPIEETFMGDQIKPLRKAEKFQEEDYLKALDQHREDMDSQVDQDGG
jgi:hypothetical protein